MELRRFTKGSGNFTSQDLGVVYGVPSTPKPARLTSSLTVLPSFCHLEEPMKTETVVNETSYT